MHSSILKHSRFNRGTFIALDSQPNGTSVFQSAAFPQRDIKNEFQAASTSVTTTARQLDLAERRSAGKQKDLGSIPVFST